MNNLSPPFWHKVTNTVLLSISFLFVLIFSFLLMFAYDGRPLEFIASVCLLPFLMTMLIIELVFYSRTKSITTPMLMLIYAISVVLLLSLYFSIVSTFCMFVISVFSFVTYLISIWLVHNSEPKSIHVNPEYTNSKNIEKKVTKILSDSLPEYGQITIKECELNGVISYEIFNERNELLERETRKIFRELIGKQTNSSGVELNTISYGREYFKQFYKGKK